MVFVESAGFAQIQPLKNNHLLILLRDNKNAVKGLPAFKKQADSVKISPFLPPDFYARQLGFFCRQEIKLDKVTRIPIRFRLGSVAQCNWLEGKTRLVY